MRKEHKMITVTQANLNEVVFQDISFDVKKRSSINGEKVEITYRVRWNGSLGECALKQASMHQSKNWYNNHRPSEDTAVMTATECERRKKLFLDLDGQVNEIDAVATTEKVKKHSAKEVVEGLMDKTLPKDQHDYWQVQYDRMQAEIKEAQQLLNSIK